MFLDAAVKHFAHVSVGSRCCYVVYLVTEQKLSRDCSYGSDGVF